MRDFSSNGTSDASSLRLRPAGLGDAPFLIEMLVDAGSWNRPPGEPPPPAAALLAVPQQADYIEGWGRAGDAGVVAEVAGRPAGACWYRRFTAEHPGYGFLGEDVPGLGLGVAPAYRQRGIGTALLVATVDLAREQGIGALSLSVSERNDRARRLYERAGFVVVGREGDSWTMRLDLAARSGVRPRLTPGRRRR
jgi:ribosomal protein S18 acetylase RimI-like enzyme